MKCRAIWTFGGNVDESGLGSGGWTGVGTGALVFCLVCRLTLRDLRTILVFRGLSGGVIFSFFDTVSSSGLDLFLVCRGLRVSSGAIACFGAACGGVIALGNSNGAHSPEIKCKFLLLF